GSTTLMADQRRDRRDMRVRWDLWEQVQSRDMLQVPSGRSSRASISRVLNIWLKPEIQ
ncbi:hypothetical protein KI387_012020, partial [Taxus chinensis]